MRGDEAIRVTVCGLGILKTLILDPFLYLTKGETLSKLVDQMMEQYGEPFRQIILDQETKQLHSSICILLNGVIVNDLNTELREDDEVTLFIPVSGG